MLSKIHKMFLRFLLSQSQFDNLRYNSLTLALSQKTARKSTRSYSFIAHSLATQEFPVIVIYWFSLHSCQNGHVLFVTQYDNNTFPTIHGKIQSSYGTCRAPGSVANQPCSTRRSKSCIGRLIISTVHSTSPASADQLQNGHTPHC